jgi:hypothetical protein
MTENQDPASSPNNALTTTAPAGGSGGTISVFGDGASFGDAQRMAKALAASSLMPSAFQGNLPNVLIALELASRIGASPLMVAQNLDIIHGRPSFRSTFLIATINGSGRFSPLRYVEHGEPGTDSWGMRAIATDLRTGEECRGPLVTIAIAKSEGWYSRKGSKWPTLTELMLCYRAAAFWCRLYAPELSLGMSTREEVVDTWGETVAQAPRGVSVEQVGSLEAALRADAPAPEPPPDEEPEREPGMEG